MCRFGHWCDLCTRKQLIYFSKGTIKNYKSIHKSVFRCHICNNYFYKESKHNFVLINLENLQELKKIEK